MKPISRKSLPQTITLFNLFKDPGTGQLAYYRTFLEGVRVDSCKTTLAASIRGVKKEYQSMVFIDPISTKGYDRRQDGGMAAKHFEIRQDWLKLTPQGRADTWTLNEGDWLVFNLGEKITECPNIGDLGLTEQQFRQEYGVRVISALPPTIDKDGSIHHWEAVLD